MAHTNEVTWIQILPDAGEIIRNDLRMAAKNQIHFLSMISFSYDEFSGDEKNLVHSNGYHPQKSQVHIFKNRDLISEKQQVLAVENISASDENVL
jgi:hypothetical protein